MPTSLTPSTAFGIQQHAGVYIESVEMTKKLSEKLIINKDATFGQAYGYDPQISFSIRGRSTTAVAAGDTVSGLTTVTGGKTFITSVRTSESKDDFPTFEISGENYPSAT